MAEDPNLRPYVLCWKCIHYGRCTRSLDLDGFLVDWLRGLVIGCREGQPSA